MALRQATSQPRASSGFTYIGLLILIALIGVALTAAADLTSTALQRDREQELLFIGAAYVAAIESYSRHSPAGNEFPRQLEDLIKDPRLPSLKRHIRRLYRDPMSGSMDWGLVRGPNDGIVGIYSKSERAPIKQAGFPPQFNQFSSAKQYADWRFVANTLGNASGDESAAAYDSGAMKRTPPPASGPISPLD